jgi:hypothetical protein
MKQLALVVVVVVTVFGGRIAHAQSTDPCGLVGGAIAVYYTATPQGRVQSVITWLAAIGGYEVGSAVCDSWTNVPGAPTPTGQTIPEQVFDAMCPTGDCVAVNLPQDPIDCMFQMNCPIGGMPDEHFSAYDFLNAAIFVQHSIELGSWEWDAIGHLLLP